MPDHLLVDCQIVGHASPRWKSAPSEGERVHRNEVLSVQRANAVQKYFETAFKSKLKGYTMEFRYASILDDDSVPSGTILVGATGRGQGESIVSAHGDKSADDQQYRRVDLSVRVARKNTEVIPTRVKNKWGHSTKTKSWWVSVGFSTGIYVAAGASYLIVRLRNMYYQTADGSCFVVGAGAGLTFKPLDVIRLTASVSFSDETSLYTDEPVGFEDFHGVHIRYTSATVALFGGYNWSYITFWGMGAGAASRPVGGWSLGGDLGLSANLNDGILLLHRVPSDYIIEEYDATEWQNNTSEWTTQHSLPIYFGDAKADIGPEKVKLDRFAAEVANDIQQ